MSEYVKLTYGSTDGAIRPATLQEVGKPLQMTMQGLTADKQYYTYAELYDGLQLVSQSLQETFRTLSAGVITLTHVSDTRSGNDYTINYSVSSTYALSSSIMTINGSPIQGVISGSTITFTVSGLGGETTYPYSVSTIDIYGENNTISGTLTTGEYDYSLDYLTITSTSDNNAVRLYSNTAWSSASIDFSTDNGINWFSVAASTSSSGGNVTTLNNGDKLIMRHTGSIGDGNTQIVCSGTYVISGNIASLQFGDNFNVSGQTAQSFENLFKDTPVTSAKCLYLGAYSTMGTRSLYGLFRGCTSLTTPPPSLPATTLANYCYDSMFYGCTSLTTAPSIASTSVPYGALESMFNSCTSLTTSPDLRSITSVGTEGMAYMFSRCSNLTTAYAPTITWDATNKTTNWLYEVANSGTLFADPSIASSIPTNSSSGCPSGWSVGAVSDEFFNYFTIKNESENTNTISLWAESYLAERDVDISVDGGKTWTAYTAKRNPGQPVAQLSAGEEMLARHSGTIGDPHYISFHSSDKISAHGNVASLQFGDNFKKINQTISTTQFNGLFIGSEYLIDASKLSFESYTATQGLGLYRAFEMCTSLIEPPDFSRIKSVNNDRSFYQTFYGCSSLTKVYAPSPSVWNSGNTYQNWLYGVAASGTIYANQTTAASIPTNSNSGCPSGWSISTT